MNDQLKQISQRIGALSEAKIERNGQFFYILSKEGKRTNIKAPINEDTERLNSAADLLAYVLRSLQSARAAAG